MFLGVSIFDYKDFPTLREKIYNLLFSQNDNIKFSIGKAVPFEKDKENTDAHFVSKPQIYRKEDELEYLPFDQLQEDIARWTHKGSNWVILEIGTVYVNVVKYSQIVGHEKVPLPKTCMEMGCPIGCLANW